MGLPADGYGLRRVKALGFSDRRLAELTGLDEVAVAAAREAAGVHAVYKRIDTCAGEFASATPYMYSTYEGGFGVPACEAAPTDRRKVVILGGGPNRIGQGIEFDYCCVHAAYALREAGFETVMVNCNPETVSTDYDTSDRLYFEPLTAEDVIALVRREQANGTVLGCIVQYGGQTPLKLSQALVAAGIPILGTSADAIDTAEDRERFQALLQRLDLRQPRNGTGPHPGGGRGHRRRRRLPCGAAPLLRAGRARHGDRARPHWAAALHPPRRCACPATRPDPDRPLPQRRDRGGRRLHLRTATTVYVAGVMEHIEEAGIHSGDSACSLPPYSLSARHRHGAEGADRGDGQGALGVVGLMNVQYAIKDGDDLRAGGQSRAPAAPCPFVAKATGVPIAKIGAPGHVPARKLGGVQAR